MSLRPSKNMVATSLPKKLHDTALDVGCGLHLPLGSGNATVEGLVRRWPLVPPYRGARP